MHFRKFYGGIIFEGKRVLGLNLDLKERKYKYFAAAILQGALLYLWFSPCVKTKQVLEGIVWEDAAEQHLVNNGLEWANTAFIALSVFGILLFLLPLVVKEKRFSQMIDLPVATAVLLGVSLMLWIFNQKQNEARELTEYGVSTECAFTFNAILFFALAAVQIFICIMCRIQAKREKLLQ